MKKATGKKGKQRTAKQGHVDRRTFVKLVPALGVAAATFPHLTSTTLAQTPTPTPHPFPVLHQLQRPLRFG